MFPIFQDPTLVFYMIPGVIIGFTIHEFGHAWTASLFGDDTAKLLGRVTLNPAAHLDPIGTILLLVGGFGWAKPVPVNVNRLQPRVLGDIVVSLAGVILNFIAALFFLSLALLAREGLLFGIESEGLTKLLFQTYWVNLILVGFNLIPLPPLDGFRVARHAFPASMEHLVEKAYQFGPWLLILFFMSGFGRRVLDPIYSTLEAVALGTVFPILRLFFS